ncbi:MAG: SLC13 family permease [Candidatus Jordarchaeum sp.]|uniref:ArsB/NhaD family transporter n=1 Tax=Candidatus Jordarchaeum sp. TaxID=2823881 RepID=UPI00404AA13C
MFLGLPFALITTFIAIAFFLVYFRGDFGKPKDRKILLEMKARLEQFDPASVIQNRELFRKTKYLLVATIGGFVVGGVVGVPFYLIALIAAGAFLVADIKEFKSNVMKVDWKLILFFVGIFIIIGGVSSTGVLRSLGETLGYLTQGNSFNTLSVLMMFSGILGGLLDNISVTTTLLYVVPFLSNTALVSERLIIWSLIYGANMGANLTPIGGIPNIIAYSMLEDENIAFGWKKFLKISVPITLITLVSGILMLELFNLALGWSYFEEMILGMLIPWG